LLVQWKDGSTSWRPLSNLKESNPVKVEEYAIANKIAEESAVSCWVRNTLRNRERILAEVKSSYWRRTHKFGVHLPKTVQEAYRIDRDRATDFWIKAIEKEIKI
jgi:hypothetical protein